MRPAANYPRERNWLRDPPGNVFRANPPRPAAKQRPTGLLGRVWISLTGTLIIVTAMVLVAGQSRVWAGNSLLLSLRWYPLGALAGLTIIRPSVVRLRKPRGVDALFAAFLLFAAVSATYSILPPLTIARTASVALLYVAVFWTVWAYSDATTSLAVENRLLIVASAVFVGGILLAIRGQDVWMRGRFLGLLANPNALGLLCVIFLPPAISRLISTRQMSSLVLVGLISGNVLLTGSRSAMLAGAAAMIYMLLRIRAWRAGIVLLAATILLVVAFPSRGAVPGAESRIVRRVVTKDSLVNMGGRVEAWHTATPLIDRRPYFGHGFGTENLAFRGVRFSLHQGEYIHNSFLGMAFQLGYVGALLFFLPLIGMLALRLHTDPFPTSRLAAYEAVVFGGLGVSLFESWIYSAGNAFAFPFWIFVMLLVRSHRLGAHEKRPLPAVRAQAMWLSSPVAGRIGARNRRVFDPPSQNPVSR